MKKLIGLAVGTLSLFAFTACEDDNDSSNNNGGDNIENPNANKTSIDCLGDNGETVHIIFNTEEITSMTNTTTGYEYPSDYLYIYNQQVQTAWYINNEGVTASSPMYDKVKVFGESEDYFSAEAVKYTCV